MNLCENIKITNNKSMLAECIQQVSAAFPPNDVFNLKKTQILRRNFSTYFYAIIHGCFFFLLADDEVHIIE